MGEAVRKAVRKPAMWLSGRGVFRRRAQQVPDSRVGASWPDEQQEVGAAGVMEGNKPKERRLRGSVPSTEQAKQSPEPTQDWEQLRFPPARVETPFCTHTVLGRLLRRVSSQ